MICRIIIGVWVTALVVVPTLACCGQQEFDVISPSQLSKLNRYSGENRDNWTQSQRTDPVVGKEFSLVRNSTFYAMFSKPHLQKALEFTELQISEIEAEAKKTSVKLLELSVSSNELSDENERKRLVEVASNEIVRFDESVKKIILPHQHSQLKGILIREYVNREGLFSVLVNDSLGGKIRLTAQQKEQIKNDAKIQLDELRQKTKSLQNDAIKSILSNLTRTQRDELIQLLGDDIEKSYEPGITKLIWQLEQLVR